jgi:hypothetical protein
MTRPRADIADLSAESTITIQPDGRIYAFGITGPLVELLAALPARGQRARRLLETMAEPRTRTGAGRRAGGEHQTT